MLPNELSHGSLPRGNSSIIRCVCLGSCCWRDLQLRALGQRSPTCSCSTTQQWQQRTQRPQLPGIQDGLGMLQTPQLCHSLAHKTCPLQSLTPSNPEMDSLLLWLSSGSESRTLPQGNQGSFTARGPGSGAASASPFGWSAPRRGLAHHTPRGPEVTSRARCSHVPPEDGADGGLWRCSLGLSCDKQLTNSASEAFPRTR